MRFRRRHDAGIDLRPAREVSAEPAPRSPESAWFWDHYEWAADQAAEFVESAGMQIADRDVADIGCGDGILSLGFHRRTSPRRLTGFDLNPVERAALSEKCRREGVSDELPESLVFDVSDPTGLPAADASFDLVTTWSAFEHIGDPYSLLREIRRVLRSDGALFLQLWPFYHSERGSHLWEWFPAGFHHLLEHHSQIVAELERSDLKPREWTEMMAREFLHLNQVTLDELQRCILAAGLAVTRLELVSHTVSIPRELARYPLSSLGIGGVKLIAVPT